MEIIEKRPLIKMYKKSEACRKEWVLWHEFSKIENKYIPIEYRTPWLSKYSKRGYSIRYIKKEDVLNY